MRCDGDERGWRCGGSGGGGRSESEGGQCGRAAPLQCPRAGLKYAGRDVLRDRQAVRACGGGWSLASRGSHAFMESVSLRAPAQLHNKMLTGGTLGDALEIGGAYQAFNRDHCNAHGEASGTKRRGGASAAAWHAAHNRRAVFACVWPPFIVERNVESPGRRRNELPELVPARIPYAQTEQSARPKAPSSAGRVREKAQTRARDRVAAFFFTALCSLGRLRSLVIVCHPPARCHLRHARHNV
jgi:hypothetical protein